jgi:hypothetical protein
MNVVYRVDLSAEDCDQLSAVVASKTGAQKRKRAQILLAASKGVTDITIAQTLPCGLSTIYRSKKRFVTEGLEASLEERPGRGAVPAGHYHTALEVTVPAAGRVTMRSTHLSAPASWAIGPCPASNDGSDVRAHALAG